MSSHRIRQNPYPCTAVSSGNAGDSSAIVGLGRNDTSHFGAMLTIVRPAVFAVVPEIPSDEVVNQTVTVIIKIVASRHIFFSPCRINGIRPGVFPVVYTYILIVVISLSQFIMRPVHTIQFQNSHYKVGITHGDVPRIMCINTFQAPLFRSVRVRLYTIYGIINHFFNADIYYTINVITLFQRICKVFQENVFWNIYLFPVRIVLVMHLYFS